MKISSLPASAPIVVLLTLVLAAACGGSDRDVRHPDPNQDPSPAEGVSDGPVRESSPEDGGGAGVDDAPRGSSGRAPVPCGQLTCGAEEYCQIKCTCCGTRIPDPSEVSADYSCLPLPPECATTSEGLCGGNRTQELPCA